MKHKITITMFLAFSLQWACSEVVTLKIDPKQSHITVDAKATGGGFKGYLTKFQASIKGDPDTLKPESAEVAWKFADLDTKKKKRNTKMLSWLDSAKHPGGSFKLSRVFDKTIVGKTQSYALGTILIHGVSKKVVFPITTTKKDGLLTIAGQAVLDTTDFNLPIIRMALVATVDPKITIDFKLAGSIN